MLTKTDIINPPGAPGGPPLAGEPFLSSAAGLKALGALAAEGLLAEALGGPVQMAAVNAKGFLEKETEGDAFGLHHLIECVALQAEVLGLHANPEGPAKGVVLEARCSAAQGGSASMILKEGILRFVALV